jgi:hypothetical protein
VALVVTLTAAACVWADSIEVQDNPVPIGTISVAAGDTDRSDWDAIPWYEFDEDFDEFFPVDIDRVQIAHDANNIYVHVAALTWEVDETWRVGLYLDADEDNTTGYNGNFLAVGADYFVEADSAYEFAAATQSDWGWNMTAELARDQTTMTDFEVAIPRDAIGDPASFDFLLFANNFCCDFQLPDDVYPNGGASLFGDFLSYELSAVGLTGDFDGNGVLDASDIDDLTAQSAAGNHPATYDLNGDGQVNNGDITLWVKQLLGSWIGDANLDREFNSSDLVSVLATGTYETDVAAVWTTGDFNGDGRTNSSDLVAALADGGYEQGAPAAAAVPEPAASLLACLATLALCPLMRRECGRRTACVRDVSERRCNLRSRTCRSGDPTYGQ